ncbi:putative signaling protein [Halobacteriovorax marinus SJ]|uniref:diguanylate cyclase n=1 Tax=Halobacteriovorax marinus (strain ATCC BAA-682 / DSM 15412 / SJ) TaxID=862908 RepID=E1WZI7_HALMS|nr:GGDEF domain-containing protein [Halobacteriovorax marinus]CBW26173.1 putative signaling protein [Halobacteriovorax marinus SJ]
MSEENLNIHYKNLLDFIFECDQLDSIKQVYELLNNFWIKEFSTSSINVFSVYRKNPDSRSCRQIWKPKKVIQGLSESELKHLKKEIKAGEELERWKNISPKEGEFFYVISCGESFSQEFYAGFKSSEKIPDKILDYLVSYLVNSSKKFKKFSEAEKLKSLVHIDDVTGLYNQRKFLKDIDDSIIKFEETGEVFSVIFIDIDHFKSVNDGHGHLVGTQLLSDVANVLKRVVRESDLSYRYGGDEFVIIVPTCDAKNAKEVGLRILNGISKEEFYVSEEKGINGSHTFKLSVSVGVATYPEDAKTRVEIISFADKMMYKAKQSGRGKVCCAGEMFTEEE